MGNSEVGHLNLGAGAVVQQDLTRIDEAVEDGTLAENEVLRAALRRRRARPPDRARLRRRRALGSTATCEALIELAASAGVAGPRRPRVHRRPRHARRRRRAATSRGRGLVRGGRRAASARSSAATSRWTATSAGTARRRRYDLLVARRAASTTPTRGEAAVKAAYERDETDEFIAPTTVGDEARDPPGRRGASRFNFRPDRMRQITRALAEPTSRDRPRRRHGRALRDADRVRGGLGLPGRCSRRARPTITLAQVIADRGRQAAARRRDREVPARDVLLQRRRGGPVRGRASASSCPSPRDVPTYDKKPEMSAREAADAFVDALEGGRAGVRDHQLRQPRHGRPHRRHPGGGQGGRDGRRVPRARSSRPSTRRGGACVDHRRPRQRRQHARARRLAEHRALAQPGAVHRHAPTARALDGEGILADVAPTVARAARDRAAAGDDGPLAARVGCPRTWGSATATRPAPSAGPTSEPPTPTPPRRSTRRVRLGRGGRSGRRRRHLHDVQARRPRRRRAVRDGRGGALVARRRTGPPTSRSRTSTRWRRASLELGGEVLAAPVRRR